EYLRSVTDPKASLERILSAPEVSGVFVPNPYFDVRERLAQYLAEIWQECVQENETGADQ
ncbi:hypothetical protein, partial [Microbulbifer sp. TYP-18]|uniref:hypothetical protein n=1 Tax=Microbulbifer sp. TYP-18 TaxID=3230024 RepID=UPI0034C5D3AE